jgi:outer membrane protein TolC
MSAALAALALLALLVPLDAVAAQAAGTGAPAAAATRPVAAVIDDYVGEGLSSNLSLRSAELEVERSQAALDAARARFFPEAALVARYTRAEGGREVELPLASVLNPVYATLNDLLAGQGRPGRFPQIEDPRFTLQREREQDTRLSLRQAVFAPAIPAAVRAQRALLEGSEYAQLALAQRLRRDIAVGYLDWLRAARAVAIVESSRSLLAENLRVNESLLRSGRITRDQVLRAEAELLAVDQQLGEVRSGRDQARSYLNFLLNRPLDAEAERAEPETDLRRAVADLATLRQQALDGRPELERSAQLVEAAGARVDAARAARWPTLALAVDAGTQGERYGFGRGSNFGTVSLLLDWPLVDGGARRAEVRAARTIERQARTQQEELRHQVQLEVQQALDRLQTSAAALRTAEARAGAAREAFRISARKRDEGALSQVEFLDARNVLTSAELNLDATRFEVLARQADLDYATGASRP